MICEKCGSNTGTIGVCKKCAEPKPEVWQTVNADAGIYRAKVIGGWVIMVKNIFQVTREMPNPKLAGATSKVTIPVNLAIGVTFVPDAEYKWEI